MCSLHRFFQAKEEESNRFFIILSAGNREEALCALNIAQHTIPAVTGMLVTKQDVSHLLQASLSEAKKSGNTLMGPAYMSDELIPAADLSVRTYNALVKGRVKTIRQLCTMELRDLMSLRNFGKKALEEAVAYRVRLGVPARLKDTKGME